MKELQFFFDFSSPFAYLASTQIEALAQRNSAKLIYRPFLLGGLFKAIGTPDVPLFAMPDAKRRHAIADISRWADHHGVKLHFPSRFPMNTVKPLRMVLELTDKQKPAFINAVFHAYWADDKDVGDDAVLVAITNETGLDGPALLAGAKDLAVKERLKAATDEAARVGMCGAPSFLIDDLLFWGQDRLIFVEKALQGWRPRGE